MTDAGVWLFTCAVQAQAEIEAMKVANETRRRNDFADAYGEDAFREVIDRLEHAKLQAVNSQGFIR